MRISYQRAGGRKESGTWEARFLARALAGAIFVGILSGGPWSFATAAPQGKGKAKVPAARKGVPFPRSAAEQQRVAIEVAAIDRERRSEVQAAADQIDAILESAVLDRGFVVGPAIDDATFVRRIYLDLAGRIPTATEVTDFLNSSAENKRGALIDDLLESADYVSNFYNFWADVLRLTERPDPNIIGDPYLHYVKDSIRTNKPYDQWVTEMLTADGKVWENPAAGYQLRDNGMPLPYVDNTVRVFLGTQIGCAQCHDHPFDEWTQHQFYQLAAFTAGTQTRVRGGGGRGGDSVRELVTKGRKSLPQPVFASFQRLVRANTFAVTENRGVLKLPHDYASVPGRPGDVVSPAVLWGEIPSSAAEGTRREQFAAWVTSSENARFSQTIANRLWRRLTGIGIVEPIDDFRPDNPPWSEPLLDRLAAEVVSSGFDLRHVVRCIVSSRAYQREAIVDDPADRENFVFQGPALRRMTAEQVWDSILGLTVFNAWPFQRATAEQMREVLDVRLGQVDFDRVVTQAQAFQASAVGNGARRSLMKEHGFRGLLLCKASELPTPLPPSHFLRQFGQSDRETIQGNTTQATVPQILAMLNGPLTGAVMERGSRLSELLESQEDLDAKIDLIFLSLLARYPDDQERLTAREELAGGERQSVGAGNVVWALLNTREFLFVD